MFIDTNISLSLTESDEGGREGRRGAAKIQRLERSLKFDPGWPE